MNTTIVIAGIFGMLAVFGGNFMIRDKERGLPFSSLEYTIPAESCFGTFLNNLKQLDAIIFIPEKNLDMAAGM